MKLYHGSDKLVSVLKPMGVNMGLRFQAPQWATYFWNSYDLAVMWTVFQLIRRNSICKAFYHIPSGKAIVKPEDYTKLKQLYGIEGYVYQIERSFAQYGYGSTPDIAEYTVTGDIIPDVISRIKVTKEIIDRCVLKMTSSEIETYMEQVRLGKFRARNLLLTSLMDRSKDLQRHKYHQLITAGELKPGDDLSKVEIKQPSSKW